MSNQAANGSISGHSTKTSSTNQTSESKPESKSSPTTSKCSTSEHEPRSRELPPKSLSPLSSETSSPGHPAEASLETLSSPKTVHDYALPIRTPASNLDSLPRSSETSTAFSPSRPALSESPLESASSQDYAFPSALETYLDDDTHTIATYGSSYINALVYTYGFPDDLSAQEEIEDEMVIEAEARARRLIGEYDSQMEVSGS
ncbi:uncharacterized protein PAC_13132 [Phialocephala subalpina]|uniref:Uncharacterized protein n=1 Tax=Phialocephala subalpina TaxID=576137 RepID=A0A1L7XDY2_9HELO|nr:uncharacterized protein PAC_13132 [Phialocephala subalpina]